MPEYYKVLPGICYKKDSNVWYYGTKTNWKIISSIDLMPKHNWMFTMLDSGKDPITGKELVSCKEEECL